MFSLNIKLLYFLQKIATSIPLCHAMIVTFKALFKGSLLKVSFIKILHEAGG